MVIGKYLRTNIKYWCNVKLCTIEGFEIWGEEGEKSFASQRSVYLNSFLALSAVRKLSELKFFVKKDAQLLDAVAAV